MKKPQNSGIAGLSRREAIGRIAGAGAGLGVASVLGPHVGLASAQAQKPGAQAKKSGPRNPAFPQVPTWNEEFRQLAPNVYGYVQGGGPDRDNVSVSNAGIVIGDEDVLVIDTLAAPIHAKRFIEHIRKVTDKPFRKVIYTHHDGDHVNGTQWFEGVKDIYSHPYCRNVVLQAVAGPAQWAKREGWALGNEPRKILPATVTIEGSMEFHDYKTVVQAICMVPAHTWGDISVYLPQYKILFPGDIAFFYVAPFAGKAAPTRWIQVCEQIDAMDVEVIVPGHGPFGGKAELGEMADYLRVLQVEAKKRYDAKMSPGRAAADIKLGKFENWIGPERIVQDVVAFYHEFEGTLVATPDGRGDAAGIAKATEEYKALGGAFQG